MHIPVWAIYISLIFVKVVFFVIEVSIKLHGAIGHFFRAV